MQDNSVNNEPSADAKPRRVVIWQLVLGALFLIAGLYNLIVRPAGPMEPSNETQWMGYYLATFVYLFVGLIFVLFGTRVLPRKPN